MDNQFTPDEAKTSMGIATHLMDMLMPQGQQEATQTQETAPQEEKEPDMEEGTSEELQGIKDEISALRQEVELVLNEPDGQEETPIVTE